MRVQVGAAWRAVLGRDVSPYLQLVQQVKQALRLGWLEPGDKLPTVNEVAASATVNPNTVLKAYKELEREGLATGRPGQGTYIVKSLTQTRAGCVFHVAAPVGVLDHCDSSGWS